MELNGKKILILVETFYNEFEFWYPYYRLKEAGAQVTVVGSGSAEVYKSKAGLPAIVGRGPGDFFPVAMNTVNDL